LYPQSYKRSASAKLHLEGAGGIESFLAELVSANSLPKSKNPYALMPDASSELQSDVLALLRDDTEYYNFLATSRRVFPKPEPADKEISDQDAIAFQPPAIGGGHTDVSADGFLNQFRAAIPEDHEFGKVASGKKRRVVFVKFWRNVAELPILNHHLAMLDKSSLDDSDIYEAELNFKGFSIKQNRLSNSIEADKLNWVYFPQMQRNEMICFQQGDLTMHRPLDNPHSVHIVFPESTRDHATFHGSFEDPTAPANAPPRQSIEAGAFVFLPEEPEVMSKL